MSVGSASMDSTKCESKLLQQTMPRSRWSKQNKPNGIFGGLFLFLCFIIFFLSHNAFRGLLFFSL